MEQILIVREVLVKFFKRYEAFILPILKFLLGLFVFSAIQSIGHVNVMLEPFTEILSPTLLIVLFALLFTVMPMNMGWMLIILSITMQYSANIEVAASVFLFLIFIFLFYARMAPKESILVLFTILAFRFNVPYLVPLIAGLYFSVTSIIPITVGVFVNAQIPVLDWLMEPGSVTGATITDMEIADLLTELPEAFAVVYEALMRSVTGTHNWLFTAVIFALVIVLVHFVSRLAIDFAKEVAIALGCVMTIFGFIVSVLVADANVGIGMMLLSTILCGVLAVIIRCFDIILDYQRAESVQFEDDNNFYHVRIVPKVILTKPKRVVKRIRPSEETFDDAPPIEVRRPRPIPESDMPSHETVHRRPRPLIEPDAIQTRVRPKPAEESDMPVYENAHRRPKPGAAPNIPSDPNKRPPKRPE